MIDYSHIPIHIRCTERYKIDPQYPDDGCKWWQYQTERGNKTQNEQPGDYGYTQVSDRYAEQRELRRRAMEILKRGETTVGGLADSLGVSRERIHKTILSGMDGLVYEDSQNGKNVVGLL